MHLFVYYKFKPEDYPHVARDAKKLIESIEQSVPGLRASLLKRPETSATGEQTWMEAYEFDEGDKDLLASKLAELLSKTALPADRHPEWFIEVSD